MFSTQKHYLFANDFNPNGGRYDILSAMKTASRRIKTTRNGTRRVIAALRMAGIAGQDKLTGIFKYLSEGHRWQLAIWRTKQEFTAEAVRRELANGASGFIVGIPDSDDALAELAESDVPVVLMNVPGGELEKRRTNLARVKNDAAAVGAEAAQILLRQGFYRSFGYVTFSPASEWSRLRGETFAKTLAASDFSCATFTARSKPEAPEDCSSLMAWLRALPKPCGLLASCDDDAFQIITACRESRLSIPDEVGVLGIDNDPILCENCEPKISSIQPDYIREGHMAAETLDRMMRGRRTTKPTVFLSGIRNVFHRESTLQPSNSGRLVQKALAYLERNACAGIGVADVARHVHCSCSLLEQRFSELQQESVYAAILRVRLNEVKRLLVHTKESISNITLKAGWTNQTPLKILFRRRFGLSMREFRRQHGL